ncbi:hypothetical protein HNQ80_001719 [Anaerosolibacter carboniphilus]|uniref:Uncharacterized protein n=1 Tax=Anaerosolibacter carboniphilus TaxID=1417629 RepID=A0A841KUD3_9FIRM|nr:hypothetical protein [Anaerosolibacter carboniphilus]MBB6215630.1 hypothetical protein [Anaerosolibacter carboniphilus]
MPRQKKNARETDKPRRIRRENLQRVALRQVHKDKDDIILEILVGAAD